MKIMKMKVTMKKYTYRRCAETMTDEAAPLVGADVMMRLGDCYFEGIGTEKDHKLALRYLQPYDRYHADAGGGEYRPQNRQNGRTDAQSGRNTRAGDEIARVTQI